MPEVATARALREDRHDAGLRPRLRQATAEAHARLDSILGALDLTLPAGYRRFLEASAAALLPLEIALEEGGVQRLVPDWPRRSRRRAIIADLARLGCIVRPVHLSGAMGGDQAWGALYVLEGSRLGSRLLLRRALQSADPVVAGATAYLAHGEGLPLWPGFLAQLDRRAIDPAMAILGARRAFDLFLAAASRP